MFKHNEPILLTRQRHEAKRAGLHYDIRLVKGDKAYSWATKKEMPKLGETITIFEQPVHTADYALSPKVVIPDGQYGAGVTTLDWVQKAIASNRENFKGKFVLNVPKTGERLLFRKVPSYGETAWILKSLPPKEETMEDKSNLFLDKVAELGKHEKKRSTTGAVLGTVAGGGAGLLAKNKKLAIGTAAVGGSIGYLAGKYSGFNKDKKENQEFHSAMQRKFGAQNWDDAVKRSPKMQTERIKYANEMNKYIEKIASIHINPAHKGELHSDLGVPQGQKIPTSKLKAAEKTAGPAEKKRLVFAENARKWNHK